MKLRILACLLLLVVGLTPPAAADGIDDAAAKPVEDAIAALEALLEKAVAADESKDALRIRRHLGRLYVGAGRPYAALAHLEAAADATLDDGHGVDRLHYAEALLATARENIRNQGMGRNVNPFLRDAIAAAKAALGGGKDKGTAVLHVRRHLVLIECYYRLDEMREALQAWAEAKADGQPPETKRRLYDLLARIRYAQERWADAGEAFEKAGHDLGAAAAWDAARKPERSIPIYAKRIAADPTNAAALATAMRGARYTGAQARLFDALADIAVPEGAAGIALLLARADLLEASGRPADALPILAEARKRDAQDVRASVRLGRVIILAGDPEDEAVWDRAADAYIDAIQRDPESDAAAEGLAWIGSRDYGRLWRSWRDERVTGRCLRVQMALAKALEDDALALMNYGNTLRVLGRTADALAFYDQAVEANPYDPAVRSDRGLALAASGRAADALAAYEKSLELDGGHLAGRQNAARSLWLAGQDDAAEAHLGAAVGTARAVGRGPGTYRHLLDRIWRTRRDPGLR